MTSEATLEELEVMSLDPIKSRILGRDFTCIGGLILLLNDKNEETICKILEILLNFVRNDGNRKYLKEFIGIKDQLQEIISNHLSGTIIYMLAVQLNKKLFVEELNRKTSIYRRESKNVGQIRVKLSQKFVIYIDGVNDTTYINDIKECLAETNGVLDIEFQLSKQRVLVKTTKLVNGTELIDRLQTAACVCDGAVKLGKCYLINPNNRNTSVHEISATGYFADKTYGQNGANNMLVVENDDGSDSNTGWSSIVKRVTRTFKDYFW